MEVHNIIRRMIDDIAESEKIENGTADKEKYERYQKALVIQLTRAIIRKKMQIPCSLRKSAKEM